MADKFPNLPGINVALVDGNIRADEVVARPTVAVVGTATKGAVGVQSLVLNASTATQRFGTEGTLSRGIIEALQGGARSCIGYRILATKGKLEHVGDITGAAGYVIETVEKGSEAIDNVEVLYDNANDILKIYSVASGELVYHSEGGVVAVDLGVVTVTGSKAANNPVGFIGLPVKVQTEEASQLFTVDPLDLDNLTMEAAAGLNLGKLQLSATNPYKVHLLSWLAGRATAYADVRLATTAALPASSYLNGVITADANGAINIDGVAGVAGDRVLVQHQADPEQNGLYVITAEGDVGNPFVLTRANDADTAAEIVEGMYVKATAGNANANKFFALVTEEPANGYVVGTTELTFAEIDADSANWLVELDVDSITVATNIVNVSSDLDILAFPESVPHKIRFMSTSLPVIMGDVLENRLGRNDQTELRLTPGSDFNGQLKVENNGGLRVKTDSAGALEEENEPMKMNLYEALVDAQAILETADIDVLTMMGVYLDDPALDGQASGATALPSPKVSSGGNYALETIAGFADRVNLVANNANNRTVVKALLDASGPGKLWLVIDQAQGATFGEFRETDEIVRTARILNWEEVNDANDDTLLLHLDRELGFSYVSDGGAVEAALAPTFDIYATDLLFYHKKKDMGGEYLHMWYTSDTDPDGETYHEVNFAYRVAAICNDLTENEASVIGVIGVRPPSNHFNPAALASWIGKSPTYDSDGKVLVNGTGLLGNKFMAGMALNNNVNTQFAAGFKATKSGELDDSQILLDANDFQIDIGKFLSIVASWPILSNAADTGAAGYIASGAPLYAGLLAGLAPWKGSTAKPIGGSFAKLPQSLAKRHMDSLTGNRYVLFDDRGGVLRVVDGPSAALPTSDFTRNMTMRLVAEAIRRVREAGTPFLGDPLSPVRRGALETVIRKDLAELQRLSEGALEGFDMSLSQSRLDQIRGTARLKLALRVINELRRINVDIALSL